MKLLFLIIALLCSLQLQVCGQGSNSLIKDITAEMDIVQSGAKGFTLNYTLDFFTIREKYANDSLLDLAIRNTFIKLNLNLSQDDKLLKSGYGYAALKDANGFYSNSSKNHLTLMDIKSDQKTYSLFIPYSSFKLSEGTQKITASLDISVKDAKNEVFKDSKSLDEITFSKPKTNYFILELDSLCVNSFDTKGQAWDHSFTGSDSPDLDFNISVGNQTVGNVHKGNSYNIVFSGKPRTFKFDISENDEVLIHLTDTDDVYDDDIASWKFDSSNMKNGNAYRQTGKKANLKAFSFTCKLE